MELAKSNKSSEGMFQHSVRAHSLTKRIDTRAMQIVQSNTKLLSLSIQSKPTVQSAIELKLGGFLGCPIVTEQGTCSGNGIDAEFVFAS